MHRRLTLRARMAIAFSLAICVILATGAGLIINARDVEAARTTARSRVDFNRLTADLQAAWEAQQAALRGIELEGPRRFADLYRDADQRASRLEQVLLSMGERAGMGDDVVDLIELTAANRASWRTDTAEVRVAAAVDGRALPQGAVLNGQSAVDFLERPLQQLRARAEQEMVDARQGLNRRTTWGAAIAVGGVGLAGASILLLYVLMGRWITRPLAGIGAEVGRLADGELDQPVVGRGPAELVELATDIEGMRQRLRAELARVVDSSYVAAAEDERARLAGDIHDDTLQTMAAVSIRLELAARGVDDPDVQEQLERCRSGIHDASRRLRNLLFELHPPALDGAGLAAALEDYADFLFGGTDTEVHVRNTLDVEPDRAVQALCYRVGRELVLNAAKHARAATLEIDVSASRGGIELVVADDGVGMSGVKVPDKGEGQGLRGLDRLVGRAGGHVRREAVAEGGTRVAVWIPAGVGGPDD